ncbi:MAG: 2-dehydropantoate 2-reductase [Candidatus Celerinatantimonas neptuna]|nr:MAG: 2-dehydropantoate 2-reductase [Candidatus Celerinatantimonas neptuna]
MIRWGILGNGAIGGLFATRLALAGQSVQLIMDLKHQKDESAQELIYQEQSASHSAILPIKNHTTDCDYLLICVKAYQVISALNSIELNRQTQLITLNNGMGIQDMVLEHYPKHSLWAAMTTHGAHRKHQTILHSGSGQTYIGAYRHKTESAPDFVTALNQAIPDVFFHENIETMLWQKLVINAVINPITAIDQCPNGELLTPSYQPLIRELCHEISLVANACNQSLSAGKIEALIHQVCQQTAKNYSSMAEDLRCQRLSEIDFINGYLIQEAEKHNIETPLNKQLYQQVYRRGYAND